MRIPKLTVHKYTKTEGFNEKFLKFYRHREKMTQNMRFVIDSFFINFAFRDVSIAAGSFGFVY